MKRILSLLSLIGLLVIDVYASETEETILSFPHFQWVAHVSAFKKVEDPVKYQIQIATDKDFKNIKDEDEIYINRYVPDKPLVPGKYFWRVRPILSDESPSRWLNVNVLTVLEPKQKVEVFYDAKSNNHQPDVQKAINRAVSFAKQGVSVEVIFPRGIYKLTPTSKYFLNIDGVENLIINGQGSKVDIGVFDASFARINQSKNVIIRGFEVDYPIEKPNLQGRIIAIDKEAGRIQVQLEKDSPEYDEEYVKKSVSHMSLIDPNVNGRLKNGVNNFFRFYRDSTVKMGKRKYSLKPHPNTINAFKEGDRFIDFLRAGGAGSLVYAVNSENVTCYDITSYSVPTLHYTAISGSVFNVLNCQAKIKEGRWFGGNADGIHTRSLKIGPWVEGCTFNGLGDDAVALYSRPMRLSKSEAVNDTLFFRPEFFDLEVGDAIAVYDPAEGKIVEETTIKSISKDRNVTFENALVERLATGGTLTKDGQIWNRSKSCGDFVIRNNKFINIRRYGTVFRAKTGVVENNYYQGTSSSAIISMNEPQYPNGLFCSDIIIRNNTIKDYDFSTNTFRAMYFGLNKLKGKSNNLGSKNVLIEGNKIEDSKAKAFYIQGGSNFILRDNRINNRETDRSLDVFTETSKDINIIK